MSLFSSIGSALSGALKTVKSIALPAIGYSIAGPIGGVVGSVLGGGSGGGAPPVATVSGAMPGGSIPGALGRLGSGSLGSLAKLGTAAAGGAIVANVLSDGTVVRRKRRRRHGITARDLNSFRRVARLVDHYAKPVHHMRNIKKRVN